MDNIERLPNPAEILCHIDGAIEAMQEYVAETGQTASHFGFATEVLADAADYVCDREPDAKEMTQYLTQTALHYIAEARKHREGTADYADRAFAAKCLAQIKAFVCTGTVQ